MLERKTDALSSEIERLRTGDPDHPDVRLSPAIQRSIWANTYDLDGVTVIDHETVLDEAEAELGRAELSLKFLQCQMIVCDVLRCTQS